MCGPSTAEQNLSNQAGSLAGELSSYMQQNYGEQQDVLNELNNVLSPIVAAGPNQQGFSEGELNALNTNAIDTAAGNYGAAARKVGAELARGGTNAGPSGVQQQIEGSIAARGAGEAAGAENRIQQENYNVGRQNWLNAMAGMNRVAALENPAGYGGLAIGANRNAFGEANTVQQQKNQAQADLYGGITSLAGGIPAMVTGWGKMLGFGGSNSNLLNNLPFGQDFSGFNLSGGNS